LYAGQRLLPEMLQQLSEAGFSPWALWPAFVDPASGQSLQVDGIFVRSARNQASG
jgi:hypothetical protein